MRSCWVKETWEHIAKLRLLPCLCVCNWSGGFLVVPPWNENGRGARSECSCCVKQSQKLEFFLAGSLTGSLVVSPWNGKGRGKYSSCVKQTRVIAKLRILQFLCPRKWIDSLAGSLTGSLTVPFYNVNGSGARREMQLLRKTDNGST